MVGVLLLVLNIYAGGHRIANGWPFACYPLFDFTQGDEIESLEVEAIDQSGEVIRSGESDLADKFTPQRFRGLLAHLLGKQNHQGSTDRFKTIWKVCVQEDPRLEKASAVRFYRVTLCTIPERRRLNPVRRELVFEITL